MITNGEFIKEIDYKKLDELVTWDTYQGMTDDEIDQIVLLNMSKAYERGNMDAIMSKGKIAAQDSTRRMLETGKLIDSVIQSIQENVNAIIERR